MKPHKHAEAIKAWADGKQIQYLSDEIKDWQDMPICTPSWFEDVEYRIKPEPTPTPEIIVPITLRTETGRMVYFKEFKLRQGDKVDVTLTMGVQGYDACN